MESEGSVDTQKAAYDAVDGRKSIRESEIRVMIAQYGKLLGKDRMVRVAGNLANQLITVVGVETYNDLRHVTYEIYADRCGVAMIDAALLVRQFGIPVVQPVDSAVVEEARTRKEASPRPPSQGAKASGDDDDGDMYDHLSKEGGIAAVWNPLHGPQGVAQRGQGTSQGNRSSASQQVGQGLQLSQGDGNLQDTASGTTGSESTHLTVDGAVVHYCTLYLAGLSIDSSA